MKDTLSNLVSMLTSGTPEQRVAAAQVLAWLKPKAPQVVKALGEIAQNGDAFLRPYAIDALGAIGNPAAVASLIPLLHREGPLRARVARVFLRIGKSAENVLVREFSKADPDTRTVILEILAMTRGEAAMGLLLDILKDPESGVLAAEAASFLMTEVDSMQAEGAAREKLAADLKKCLKDLGRKAPSSTRACVLKLLGRVADPSMRTIFMSHTAPSHAPGVRASALEGLRGFPLTTAQVQQLIAYLGEGDFLNVGGPALKLLEDVKPSGSAMAGMLAKLLKNPRPEVRLFAMKGLGSYPTPSTARLLLPFLESTDVKVRILASEALGQNPEAREGLVKKFLAGRDLEEVGRYFEALYMLAPNLDQAHLKKLVDRFMKLVDADDPVKDLYRRVLANALPDLVGPLLLNEAKKLRMAQRFDEALRVLQTISGASGGRVGEDARYELAITTLLMRSKEPETSEGDPVIGHFCQLLKSGYKLFDKVRREKMLQTDDLFYLGHRFVERLNEEKRFGSDLLNYLIKKEPETKASVQAMQKLKVEGLA